MSPQSPWAGVVEEVRRTLGTRGRHRLGQFSIEGARLVERALRAGRTPRRVIVSESAARSDGRIRELLVLLQEAGTDITRIPDGVVHELAEERKTGVIFGLCDIPKELSVGDLARQALSSGPLLVLHDLEEPGNVGALVRTALAAGASGLIALGTTDPFHPKAVRTSMGALFKLPIVQSYEVEPVVEQLSPLRRLAAVSSGGDAPWQADLTPQVALFIGQEAAGLPPSLAAKLDGTVSIPMPGGTDSYSVNAAAAILLYEVLRRANQ